MTLVGIGVRNSLRNKLRTSLTIAGIAIAVVAFLLLRTLVGAWTAFIDNAAADRLSTRAKFGFGTPLPLHYKDEIQQIPGVERVCAVQWFGGRNPKRDTDFFPSFSVDPHDYLSAYDEIAMSVDDRKRWESSRTGALVGDELARDMGWKVGDRVTLDAPSYTQPRHWRFEIAAIYHAKRRSVVARAFVFHYAYWNADRPPWSVDKVSWFVIRVDSAAQSASVARAIDQHFADHTQRLLTMSERATAISSLGRMSTALGAVNGVSLAVLLIMALIVGNTIALGVRERTSEYGLLCVLGFGPWRRGLFVVSEAIAIGALGGLVGVAVGYPFIERGVGRYLVETLGKYFPFIHVELASAWEAVVLAMAVSATASIISAVRVSRMNALTALRSPG